MEADRRLNERLTPTDEVVEGRRPSSYFSRSRKAKKKGGQLVFDEWTGDRIEENKLIN